MKPAEVYFRFRGYVLAGLWVALFSERRRSETALRPMALIAVAAGFFLRIWAARHIGSHSNGVVFGPMNTNELKLNASLATGGPYAITRHPLYVANVLVAAGTVLFANLGKGLKTATLLFAVAAHHIALALMEERHLQKSLGSRYLSYREDTPLIPRLRRRGEHATRTVGPAGWSEALAIQGGNLSKAALGIALLAAARWRR